MIRNEKKPLKNSHPYCFLTLAKGFAIMGKRVSIPVKIRWHMARVKKEDDVEELGARKEEGSEPRTRL
jgi:hypothetical protein